MSNPERARSGALERLKFFLLWLQRPTRLGAVVPSSRSLAEAMAAEVEVSRPGLVIELGGGTGNVTAALIDAGVREEDLIVIEREAALAAALRRRFPTVTVVRGDARRLRALLNRSAAAGAEAAPPVKAVVSSLPLLLLSREDQHTLLTEVFALLEPDAPLVQFTYGPRAPISTNLARRHGLRGSRAQWVLDNVPPAAVWSYRRIASQDALARSA